MPRAGLDPRERLYSARQAAEAMAGMSVDTWLAFVANPPDWARPILEAEDGSGLTRYPMKRGSAWLASTVAKLAMASPSTRPERGVSRRSAGRARAGAAS